MTRTGARAETLAYTYSSGTNKLSKVTVGGVQKSYAYNADGTMKTDGLRGLTVTYNPLKLPNKIKVSSNTGTVDYIYDANGNKLAVKQGGIVKNVYCGDFITCAVGLDSRTMDAALYAPSIQKSTGKSRILDAQGMRQMICAMSVLSFPPIWRKQPHLGLFRFFYYL